MYSSKGLYSRDSAKSVLHLKLGGYSPLLCSRYKKGSKGRRGNDIDSSIGEGEGG